MLIPNKKVTVPTTATAGLITFTAQSLDNLYTQISIQLNIPIDTASYLAGKNLIDCIDDDALPDFRGEVEVVSPSLPVPLD